MVKRIHIVIAESSAIIRYGLVTLLQRGASVHNIEIVEVADLSLLLSGTIKHAPDILIVNPSNLGVFSSAQLRNNLGNENLKIIALQSALSEQSLLQNYDETISIYDSIETIIGKINSVAEDGNDKNKKKDLSQREKEVIVCVVKGMTNKQIADILCLSAHTVIAHRRNIASKLQIHTPSGLTIYAIVNKLVNLADIKNCISQNKDSE